MYMRKTKWSRRLLSRTEKTRPRHGNMLALIAATCFIIIVLLLFALSFVRLTGTNQEQRTAIESAALAAAKECSRICINTPECGWVSLSDYAPNGSATAAPDGFDLPVRSINTLIGTARLDLIIGYQLSAPNGAIFINAAKQDLKDALSAKDQLETVLQDAIQSGGTATDKDGNTVTPYDAALQAYQANQIRLSGGSNYVNGSLKLSLGELQGGTPTNIPVPQPTATAPVPPDTQISGFYKSYTSVPFQGVDFIFAGIGKDLKIVDHKKWVPSAGLSYQFPTIIKAEADQTMKDLHSGSGYTVHAIAAAQPVSVYDPLPAPGALGISMPDGKVPEINYPQDCYLNSNLQTGSPLATGLAKGPATLLSPDGGDYPIDAGSAMSPMNWPLDGTVNTHYPADIWMLSLHDWVRRAGTKANIDSVVQMQTTRLDSPSPSTVTWLAPVVQGGPYLSFGPIPAGIIHIFKFAPDGIVTYQSKPLTPYPLYVASNKQMYSEKVQALDPSTIGKVPVTVPGMGQTLYLDPVWDVHIRDEVRQPGTIRGGKHAGEPLAKPIVSFKNLNQPVQHIAMKEHQGLAEVLGTTGSGFGADKDDSDDDGKHPDSSGALGPGFPPFVSPHNDFGINTVPVAPVVPPYPAGSGLRPFYLTYGTAVDIKFRREIDVTQLYPGSTTQHIGYFGIVGP